jgi:lipopolysaccharide/colanic/teichoic acid biosynthesis glycosyltransferase
MQSRLLRGGDRSWSRQSSSQPFLGYRSPARERQALRGVMWFAKRTVDVALGTILVVALAPLMVVIAIAIKLDSPGPVFFRHDRVGGRRVCSPEGRVTWEAAVFEIVKFRSMIHEADESLHRDYIRAFIEGETQADQGGAEIYKLESDPRVTRVGRMIRITSLDELPQLFNVLAGKMSLVGPRPVPTYEVEAYEPWQMERLHALPGMTGQWQVHGRGVVSFDEMVRMDIWYTRNRSVWLDFKLLVGTIRAVASMRGAQ